MSLFDYQGNVLSVSANALDYEKTVKGIAHRGYSSVAPENTLPAYKLAKQNGFNYAECDVRFTSDGVAVLLHDETIDRTSDGTGTLSQMTYLQVSEYDFGSWKSATYANTSIPTFEEFIALCRNIGLYPYVDLDVGTEAQIQGLIDVVNAHGMRDKTTWISSSLTYLTYVHSYDSSLRLGYVTTPSSASIASLTALQATNEVFFDAQHYLLTSENIALCASAKIPLETWTIDTANTIVNLDAYITGVTSNSLVAGIVLYNASID